MTIHTRTIYTRNQHQFMLEVENQRKVLSMTVAELCKAINSNPSSYYRWRNGLALISLEDAMIMCRVLDIDKISF